MKSKMLISMLFCGLLFFISCDNDDNEPDVETINGVWNLTNVRRGFVGVDIDYAKEEVRWTFNMDNGTLIVENNVITTGPEDIYAGFDTGEYNISIEENEGLQTLFVNDINRGVITFLDENLQIDERVSDGFLFEFER